MIVWRKMVACLIVSFGVFFVFNAESTFAEGLNISISSDLVNLNLLPENFTTGTQTISASTSSASGYTISMKTLDGSSDLVREDDQSFTIPTITVPGEPGSISVDNFGYGYGYSVDGGANFKPVPDPESVNGDILFKTNIAGQNTHTITWGAKVSHATLSGTYAGSFDIYIVANLEPELVNEFKYEGQVDFDGTNYLDTRVALFSEQNLAKDFVVKFTIDEIGDNQTNQAVLFGDMDETGSPYPGVLFRMMSSRLQVIANSNAQSSDIQVGISSGDVIMKRETGIISYSVDGGQTFIFLKDYDDFAHPFDTTATFGAGKNGSNEPFRHFIGKLSNMSVELKDPTKYKVIYKPNGGSGTVNSEAFSCGTEAHLTTETYTRPYYIFDHWNTEPDDSGISYQSGEVITNLAEAGQTIALYAIWKDAPRYTIVFHSNTSPDETISQNFIYSIEQNLSVNTFTNGELEFAGWNTMANGQGLFYEDGQNILNLTETDGDIINLYAMWSDISYTVSGDTVFEGNNYLDSGISLFSDDNIERDFVILFEIADRATNSSQATMMSAMDETGSPWPGMVYRVSGNVRNNEFVVNASSSTKNVVTNTGSTTTKVQIRRAGGIVYEQINNEPEQTVLDMATLTHNFDVPVTFGASLKADGTPQRYFKGTLSNIKVYVLQSSDDTTNLEQEIENEESVQATTETTSIADFTNEQSKNSVSESSIPEQASIATKITPVKNSSSVQDDTTVSIGKTNYVDSSDGFLDPLGETSSSVAADDENTPDYGTLTTTTIIAATAAASIILLKKKKEGEE